LSLRTKEKGITRGPNSNRWKRENFEDGRNKLRRKKGVQTRPQVTLDKFSKTRASKGTAGR
jgi:hypothetical protein